ncbi:NADPH:quinone reductase [Nocardioides terrae]|uniref:NADPH:quinone reductase n=1 Tax=Nocardioides terrae TaxID=574651 RepID=A0A1I1KJA7_9ACTN|nr:zinc-binding dehydrogenase [Nocardioides terrae]SFC60645.1 NADPH:quinone reductase [Nocardioides terrae]
MSALLSHPGIAGPVLEEVDLPPVGSGDLRVEVIAAGVNPIDTWVAAGFGRDIFGLTGPVGLGWDLTGVVREVGTEVDGFHVGDVVAADLSNPAAPVGAHATETVLSAAAAALVPEGLDPVAAASIPLNAIAAAQAVDLLGAGEGRTLLVTGAAGAVGGYAVPLARRAGWLVTGLARDSDRGFVTGAGAVDVVTQVPSRAYDAVLDAAALQADALGAVRDGGRFVGVVGGDPLPPEREITTAAVQSHADGARLAELLALHVDGTLAVRVAGTVPLSDAATAYDKVAGGGQRGRWLLVP